MALKDWKKNKGNYWNKKERLTIFIEEDFYNKVRVEIWSDLGIPSATREETEDFATKPQALKFAKSYMRTH